MKKIIKSNLKEWSSPKLIELQVSFTQGKLEFNANEAGGGSINPCSNNNPPRRCFTGPS